MGDHTTYVRIDGEPFLSRAKAYREKHEAWHSAWGDFSQSKGGTGFSQNGRDLVFAKPSPPEGWTKPDRHGLSHPKAKHPDLADFERMRAEHPRPDPRVVFGDEVCFDALYETADSGGKLSIGGIEMTLYGPHVGWAGDTLLGHIPDAEAFARSYAAEHPERRIVGPAGTWAMPKGLTRITKAEYDLVFAQHEVEEERKASSLPSPSDRA